MVIFGGLKMLVDKVVVVTGATRGIGKAIALELASQGADIAFNYVSNDELAIELETQIQSFGRKVYSKKFNISDFDEVKTFMDEVIEKMGRIDCLVNNAGITRDKALVMMDKEDWNAVIDVNLTGTFNATRCAIFDMIKRKSGQIINITSVSGILGLSRQSNYSASKAGIIGFTKALAKEVADYNIRVNAVAPGYIDTEMAQAIPEKLKEKINKDFIPMKRFGQCEEVAKFVAYLLGGGDSYMTGIIIPIDGGRVAF
jgi:3-oxoacyl-[acyl-carrier protein] reductase